MITNVSFDHEQYLGSSLESIAFEKAGVLKRNVPLILGPVGQAVEGVVQEQARHKQVRTFTWGREFTSIVHPSGSFDVIGMDRRDVNLRCALEGDHQVVNAACALALLEASGLSGTRIAAWAIRQGLEEVFWPGRLERLRRHPLILCDGAHNPAAAECLGLHLQRNVAEQRGRRLILIVGMMRDKNLVTFLKALAPLADVVIVTQIDSPRSATVQALQEALPATAGSVYARESPGAAIDLATGLASKNDLVCITGSLFLVGQAKSLLLGKAYEPVVG